MASTHHMCKFAFESDWEMVVKADMQDAASTFVNVRCWRNPSLVTDLDDERMHVLCRRPGSTSICRFRAQQEVRLSVVAVEDDDSKIEADE